MNNENHLYRRQLFQLALPAMMENILQILMGVTDTYLVTRLGLVAISGVSVANNIITIYQAIFIALGAATSSLIAKYIGQKNAKGCLQLQADSIVLAFIVSLILGGLSLFGGESLIGGLGTNQSVAQIGGLYLAIVGGGIVSLGILTILGAIHRAQGRPKLPMYVSAFTNILNAILSALSITLFDFGVVGIAGATVLSRVVGCLILARALPMVAIGHKLRFKISHDLVALSLPTAGERLMMRAGDVAIIAIIVSFGTRVVAGNAVGETITQFNYMPGMGVATAVLIMVAKAFGEKEYPSISRILKFSYASAVAMMFAIGGLVYAMGPVMLPLFTKDTLAMESARTVMLFSFLGGPATAGTLIYTALWQALGKANLPFYATSIGMWGVRIVLGYLLGIGFGLGLAGVWLATVLDNLFRWAFLAFLYRYYRHKLFTEI